MRVSEMSDWTSAEATYLLCPHEEQMLDGMGHAGHVVGIREIPHIDVHRGAGLIRIWVMHQKRL